MVPRGLGLLEYKAAWSQKTASGNLNLLMLSAKAHWNQNQSVIFPNLDSDAKKGSRQSNLLISKSYKYNLI